MPTALILGTGPSLSQAAHLIPQFKGLIFGCNNTYEDFPLDIWLACDPKWHSIYSPVSLPYCDCWHWDKGICEKYGYRYVEGVWMVDGVAYPRDQYETPPGPCGGLWMQDKSRISLNHCSGAQLLNLSCNQYDCETVLLIGHDFKYDKDKPRHYFSDLSDVAGEYPEPLRKHSKFIKNDGTDDLLAVYQRIANQPGLPRIINCTPDSALPWFPMGRFEDYL